MGIHKIAEHLSPRRRQRAEMDLRLRTPTVLIIDLEIVSTVRL
jgi:hypothetical protein